MKALILCGGLGLRIKGNFEEVPKPLIVVRGRPLLAFILDGYIASGIRDFVLLVGLGEDQFHAFARHYAGAGVTVKVLQTGVDTPTGGRLKKAEPLLAGEEDFFATYGDGVSDLDFTALLRFHRQSGRLVTLTAVRPQLPFGLLELNDQDGVAAFREKPVMDRYTNGGFFVMRRAVLAGIHEDADLETDVLPTLSAKGELGAYRHDGFWKNMDTYKDYLSLNAIDLAARIRFS